MIRSLMLPVCGAIALLLSTGRGEAGLILDQSFDTSGDYFGAVTNEVFVSQTFTVGRDGLLSRVDLQVQLGSIPASDDLILTILGTAAGVPDASAVLGSVSIPQARFPSFDTSNGSFVDVDVSRLGIAVTPGDVLALELSYPTGSGFYHWLDNSLFEGTTYAGGSEFTRLVTDSSWRNEDPWDAGFQTWVEPASAVPEPSSFMLVSIGCLCGIARTRKRRNA